MQQRANFVVKARKEGLRLFKILVFIFLIQIVYVSAYTLRMILTLKGQKYIAALISMGEIVIYVLGLNLVLNYLKQPEALIVYAVGYGLGVLLGAWIEEKIALGYITVKVICNQLDGSVANALRDKGYGVTAWVGSGRDGDRLVMEILAKRKTRNCSIRRFSVWTRKHLSLLWSPNSSMVASGHVPSKSKIEQVCGRCSPAFLVSFNRYLLAATIYP